MKRDKSGYVDFGKAELSIQALIILNVIAFSVETLPNLSDFTRASLRAFEVFTVIMFTIEYLLRFVLCKPRGAYVFSFWGIIDLVAILPFYFALAIDLRSIRFIRMLRLFRILKLARYSSAVKRYRKAFVIVKEELILFGVISLIIIWLSSIGIYYFENEAQPEAFASVFHGLWWSIVTLTTVGYGDAYPITLGGQIFTTIILIIGLGIIAVPTGLFASALSKIRNETQGLEQTDDEKMEN